MHAHAGWICPLGVDAARRVIPVGCPFRQGGGVERHAIRADLPSFVVVSRHVAATGRFAGVRRAGIQVVAPAHAAGRQFVFGFVGQAPAAFAAVSSGFGPGDTHGRARAVAAGHAVVDRVGVDRERRHLDFPRGNLRQVDAARAFDHRAGPDITHQQRVRRNRSAAVCHMRRRAVGPVVPFHQLVETLVGKRADHRNVGAVSVGHPSAVADEIVRQPHLI